MWREAACTAHAQLASKQSRRLALLSQALTLRDSDVNLPFCSSAGSQEECRHTPPTLPSGNSALLSTIQSNHPKQPSLHRGPLVCTCVHNAAPPPFRFLPGPQQAPPSTHLFEIIPPLALFLACTHVQAIHCLVIPWVPIPTTPPPPPSAVAARRRATPIRPL